MIGTDSVLLTEGCLLLVILTYTNYTYTVYIYADTHTFAHEFDELDDRAPPVAHWLIPTLDKHPKNYPHNFFSFLLLLFF